MANTVKTFYTDTVVVTGYVSALPEHWLRIDFNTDRGFEPDTFCALRRYTTCAVWLQVDYGRDGWEWAIVPEHGSGFRDRGTAATALQAVRAAERRARRAHLIS